MCCRIASTALSPYNQAVPFEVGKPLKAHVAAEGIQEKINPHSYGGSPSCFFTFFMVKKTLFKRSLNFSSSVEKKSHTVPLGANCLPYIDVKDVQEFT